MIMAYRLSDFLHAAPVGNGIVALFNALTFGVLFVTEKLADSLHSTVGGIFSLDTLPLPPDDARDFINRMQERRLAFPLGERHDLDDYRKVQDILRQQGIGIIYFMLADGCNLGCKYCYIENGAGSYKTVRLMSAEVMDRGLETFSRILNPTLAEPQVILYGGEPLLNRPGVTHAIERVHTMKTTGQLPAGTGITLNTNGTLIDDAFVKFIRDKGIQIALSLDGNQVEHDAMRPFKGGRGSFAAVMRTCQRLRAGGVDFGFSVTINGRNIAKLQEILLWIHETFDARSIGFNILIDRHPELLGMSEEAYAHLVTEQLIACFRICRERGIYEDRIMRKVDAFIRGYPYLYDCGAPGDQIVITPDGMVGVCQAYGATGEHFVPLEELEHPSTHPVWQMWRFRSPLYQRQCYDCIALGLCGGGCPYSANLKTGSIWGLDEVFCRHAKGTIKFLLEELYRQATS